MNTFDIEWAIEDRLVELVGSTLNGLPVYKGIVDTLDDDSQPVLLPENHVAIYVTELTREHPVQPNYTAEVLATVATLQDADLPDGVDTVRDFHKATCLALRDKLFHDDLAEQMTTATLRVSGVYIGDIEVAVVGRHHVTRHHFQFRWVCGIE